MRARGYIPGTSTRSSLPPGAPCEPPARGRPSCRATPLGTRWIFPAFLALLLPVQPGIRAQSSRTGGPTVTYMGHGIDLLGRSAFEKIFLDGTGRLTWKTASRGGPCASEGGIYETSLSPEEADELARAAMRAVREQPGDPNAAPVPRRSRQTVSSVSFAAGKNSGSADLTKLSAGVKSLNALLLGYKTRTKPVSAIRMKAAVKGKSVRVGFVPLGPRPFTFLLPQEADEAFSLDSRAAAYARKPGEFQFLLKEGDPSVSADLTAPAPPKDKAELRYWNAAIEHRFEPPQNERTDQEMRAFQKKHGFLPRRGRTDRSVPPPLPLSLCLNL